MVANGHVPASLLWDKFLYLCVSVTFSVSRNLTSFWARSVTFFRPSISHSASSLSLFAFRMEASVAAQWSFVSFRHSLGTTVLPAILWSEAPNQLPRVSSPTSFPPPCFSASRPPLNITTLLQQDTRRPNSNTQGGGIQNTMLKFVHMQQYGSEGKYQNS